MKGHHATPIIQMHTLRSNRTTQAVSVPSVQEANKLIPIPTKLMCDTLKAQGLRIVHKPKELEFFTPFEGDAA